MRVCDAQFPSDKDRQNEIPIEFFIPHQEQAEENHMQTVQCLEERGGLSSKEAVAIIKGVRYSSLALMSNDDAWDYLEEAISKWKFYKGKS